MSILAAYTSEIINLCKKHNVKSLYVFGSVLTDQFRKESDIDLIVDFKYLEAEAYADNYFNFKFSLQDILKRPIDLLEEKAIKNPYFRKSIDSKKQLLYGFWNQNLSLFAKFQNDLRTKRAVERNIEIIGEALNRILKQEENIKISNARRIVDTRNRIAHGYDAVSDDILWGIVIKHLPVLQTEVQVLLGE